MANTEIWQIYSEQRARQQVPDRHEPTASIASIIQPIDARLKRCRTCSLLTKRPHAVAVRKTASFNTPYGHTYWFDLGLTGAPGQIRTADLLVRSQTGLR
jgi:hypothetical protein